MEMPKLTRIALSISSAVCLGMAAPTPAVAAPGAGDIAVQLLGKLFETGIEIAMNQFIDKDPFKNAKLKALASNGEIEINITNIAPITSSFDQATFDFITGPVTQIADGRFEILFKDVTWQGTVALTATEGAGGDSKFCAREGSVVESDNISIVSSVLHVVDPHNGMRKPGTTLNIPHTVNAAQIAAGLGKCEQSFAFINESTSVNAKHSDSLGEHSDIGSSVYTSSVNYDADISRDDYDIAVGTLQIIARHRDTAPPKVPAPLPALGALTAFHYSRKIRRRINDLSQGFSKPPCN